MTTPSSIDPYDVEFLNVRTGMHETVRVIWDRAKAQGRGMDYHDALVAKAVAKLHAQQEASGAEFKSAVTRPGHSDYDEFVAWCEARKLEFFGPAIRDLETNQVYGVVIARGRVDYVESKKFLHLNVPRDRAKFRALQEKKS